MTIYPLFEIRSETPEMIGAINGLLDSVFGPARFEKASHLYRDGLAPIAGLSWVALSEGELVGTIRYWPILVGDGDHPALLLGPLGIAPRLAGKGIGRALTFLTLDLAAKAGHDLVLLVGDVDYYKRFGFVPAIPHGIAMPGETRPERLQVAPLRAGILGRVTGDIRHLHSGLPTLAAGALTPRRARRRMRNLTAGA